jgi:hypothetical protein
MLVTAQALPDMSCHILPLSVAASDWPMPCCNLLSHSRRRPCFAWPPRPNLRVPPTHTPPFTSAGVKKSRRPRARGLVFPAAVARSRPHEPAPRGGARGEDGPHGSVHDRQTRGEGAAGVEFLTVGTPAACDNDHALLAGTLRTSLLRRHHCTPLTLLYTGRAQVVGPRKGSRLARGGASPRAGGPQMDTACPPRSGLTARLAQRGMQTGRCAPASLLAHASCGRWTASRNLAATRRVQAAARARRRRRGELA